MRKEMNILKVTSPSTPPDQGTPRPPLAADKGTPRSPSADQGTPRPPSADTGESGFKCC